MAFEQTSFPDYSSFIHLSRYSRYDYNLKRRETWEETVSRWFNFWTSKYPELRPDILEAALSIHDLDVMPSMRSLMTAGPALDKDNVAGYNCAYEAIEGTGPKLELFTEEMQEAGFDEPITIQIKNPIAFDEAMYILMCGTGIGFSVERQYIANLPTVGKPLDRAIYRRTNKNYPGVDTHELSTINRRTNTIRVKDSKYGWASALRILIVELYNGNYEVQWNTDEVRASGEVLKTFGGRASGPGPLNDAFRSIVEIFKEASGRKLTSTEAHTIMCIIADAIVVGGVRRSAMISLSNLSDDRMRHVKSGEWWNEHPEYRLANNSAVYTEKPDAETFIREWKALIESKSGERGIFNRAANQFIASRNGRRDTSFDFGCNPCSEIILRSRSFCNLSEIVVRAKDTFDQLARKARIAAFIGTLQATLTNFKYLNPEWRKNTEEEALLGVSLTGIMDHPLLSLSNVNESGFDLKDWPLGLNKTLEALKQVTIDANQYYAKRLGINPAAAITCVR